MMEKHAKLVRRLVDLTQSGAVDWKTTVEDYTFQLSLPKNTVRISPIAQQNSRIVILSLLDGAGDVVESFSSSELADDQGPGWDDAMLELYDRARRSALGVEKILDDVIDELDSIIPF